MGLEGFIINNRSNWKGCSDGFDATFQGRKGPMGVRLKASGYWIFIFLISPLEFSPN